MIARDPGARKFEPGKPELRLEAKPPGPSTASWPEASKCRIYSTDYFISR
jgi:hypothetical protein